MEKIISYPISFVYYFFFGLCLLVFHPVQWACLKIGYQAHKKSVDVLNLLLTWCTYILGTRYTFEGREKIPANVPLIIVSNHQSLYDIISIVWFLRKVHPKFVSKQELGKGIPSVSFNLRHGGSVLIDRKDPRQALPVIKGLGDYIEQHNRSAVIFPEGTRSKNGKPKEFAQTGLKILCKAAPSAYVVPLTINNSWKMAKFGYFPLGLGNHLKFTVHEPMAVSGHSFEEIMEYTEKAVTGSIKY
ncbi:1-acyl-sn-glycerol-3-phosphate acyltransferase [Flavobacterium sp. MAH-1]|uniref:1-acyl-sn-glycerol-3-phosphate acyltransferase n=1 Tax=Flavobacterium agri TaxID=2743471 RepID=A0A7Y8Y0G7_9FLAO|nr:lysophospholipid acyltransferase family protein [Flavobacterium agri]NUY80187.1 1-acyl-sn-glycerol-3-phosphate acyltransferase [Flavobacterium agri]NYA70212.1 1-acyl-sn-glycerol-3-phosphate acyltransferase [Flavobacterium agri]